MLVKTKELLKALTKCKKLHGKAKSLPILNYVHLKSDGSKLLIESTDLDKWERVEIVCNGKIDICLPMYADKYNLNTAWDLDANNFMPTADELLVKYEDTDFEYYLEQRKLKKGLSYSSSHYSPFYEIIKYISDELELLEVEINLRKNITIENLMANDYHEKTHDVAIEIECKGDIKFRNLLGGIDAKEFPIFIESFTYSLAAIKNGKWQDNKQETDLEKVDWDNIEKQCLEKGYTGMGYYKHSNLLSKEPELIIVKLLE